MTPKLTYDQLLVLRQSQPQRPNYEAYHQINESLGRKPLYQHDCTGCQFLGSYDQEDWYCCGSLPYPTMVRRYGDQDSHYRSFEYQQDMFHPEEPNQGKFANTAWHKLARLAGLEHG